MADIKGPDGRENISVKTHWNIPFEHFAGKTASRYFIEMRDHRKIMGTKCPQCHRVLIPARSFCEQCFGPADEWVEVGDQGTIETFSINCMKYVGMPDPPYILAIIKLDGADTGMMHFIGGLDLSNVDAAAGKLKIGTRVQAVWKENREGLITDIECFRVIDGV